jgi:bacterioferritin-associated ferredoxin
MIICQCMGLTDRAIRKTVREGARSHREVARVCAAGSCCGGCAAAIDKIIEIETKRESRTVLLGLAELATG